LRTLDPADRNHLYVVFVGATRAEDEGYAAELAKTVATAGLRELVSFAGMRTDVPDIFRAADIAVHSSVLPEPGGTVVIEAMSYGAPVIAANRGGHIDYFEPGTGLLHDVERPHELAAHMMRLAKSPEDRARISEVSKERAKQFSIVATARKMEAVYDDLLGRG